jgi:hypothetical protein
MLCIARARRLGIPYLPRRTLSSRKMDERDETSRRWFDLGTVKLEMDNDVSDYFDEEALIALSGALSDSTVTAKKVFGKGARTGDAPPFEAIRLQVHHPAVFSLARLLRQDEAGDWYVENAKFRIHADYLGRRLSARSLTIQARAAQQLGFRYIVLDAVGDYNMARFKYPDDRWVGYWVWPRLGFDADLPAHLLRKLPRDFQERRRVSELMGSEEGLNWWELYGDTLNGARFDLTADSMSWQLLAQYNERRDIKV